MIWYSPELDEMVLFIVDHIGFSLDGVRYGIDIACHNDTKLINQEILMSTAWYYVGDL